VRTPSASSLVKLALLVTVVATAVWFTRFTDTGRQITFQSIRDELDAFPPVWTRLLYIGVYIAGTVLLLPGTLLSFAGSQLFPNLFEAVLYTWIGATAGATLAFLLAKLLGRDFVNQLLAGRLQGLDERLSRHGFTGLLVLRLVPLFPFNGINFGSGLTGIRLRDYVLATGLGILPGVFVYQYLFARLGEKVLRDGFELKDLLDPHLLSAVGLFALFILAGKWLSARLQPRAPQPPPPA
jgi:uncharacterized membrane protein YdjX (TVP38/TMEM64 family)